MFFRDPPGASRYLVASFLALTLLPACVLLWLGWRFVEQDRVLEERRAQENRVKAADLIAAALQQAIESDERKLDDPDSLKSIATQDARVIVIAPERIDIYPDTRLAYYPFSPPLREAPADLFAAAEDDEHRLRDFAAAIEKLRRLDVGPDDAVRAGAELRLARNLRRSGQLHAALDVYARLAQRDGIGLFGRPADLVGRHARCIVLAELKRTIDLRREADMLYADLTSGRWRLERSVYFQYAQEISSWLERNEEDKPMSPPEEWAEVAAQLWEKRQAPEASNSKTSGHDALRFETGTGALIWRSSGDRVVALAAGPSFVKSRWISAVDSLLASQGLRLMLRDPQDHVEPGLLETQRAAAETHLPWTITIISESQPNSRRTLLIAGLASLLISVLAGSYFIGRAVSRELTLARLQSDFVSAVSHEFRTPLTALGQTSELLLDGRVVDPGRLHHYYEAQARATGRLHRLVESLLEFGRMEAGRKPYRMEKLDPSELVRSVVADFQNDAGSGYTIEMCLNGAPPIDGDRDALSRALRNLLDNAAKYSPDCHTIRVELTESNGRAAISVQDRGVGIPRSEQKQIFRKFVRGAAAKTHGIKGTGVGLAMVDHIVRAHGGQIRLDSEPGKGSIFTIVL